MMVQGISPFLIWAINVAYHALGKMILLLAIVLGWLAFGIMTLARLGKRKCRKQGGRLVLPAA